MNPNCHCNPNCVNNCTQVATVYSVPGATGLQGPGGPQGIQGPQGEDALPFSLNFLSLQSLGIAVDIPATPDTISTPYNAIVSNGDTQTILPPTIPGDGPVTLVGGHTYLINWILEGNAFTDASTHVLITLLINGVPYPDTGSGVEEWASGTTNSRHFWVYTALTDTTIEYILTKVNSGVPTITATYLNIVQLN